MEETKPEAAVEKKLTVAESAAIDANKSLVQSFAGKMCPILSSGGIKGVTPSPLVGANGMGFHAPQPEGEALGCQGPNCQWFIITGSNNFGHATAGGCAVGLLPSAIVQLGNAMNEQAKALVFSQKFSKHKG